MKKTTEHKTPRRMKGKWIALLLAAAFVLPFIQAAIPGCAPRASAEDSSMLATPEVTVTVVSMAEGSMQADGFGQLTGTVATLNVTMTKVPGANRYFVVPLRRVAPGNSSYSFEKTGEGTMPTVVLEEG